VKDDAGESEGVTENIALKVVRSVVGCTSGRRDGRAGAARPPALDLHLLWIHYPDVDDLSIDALASLRAVHRSAARWIARAREAIIVETSRRLREKLAVTPSEAQSIVGLVQSQLDLSMWRLLPDG
jgi:hypothetical protein